MKVTINIDCTPEEARTFMGLPDVAEAQQAVVAEWKRQALESMSTMDPQTLFQAWMPGGAGATGMPGTDVWEQLQKALWAAMPEAGGAAKK